MCWEAWFTVGDILAAVKPLLLVGRVGEGPFSERHISRNGLRVCQGKVDPGFPEKTNENKRV
jgi:hypothetical protein